MKKLIVLALLGAGAFHASASTMPTLTITEVSDTELDYSWSTGGSGIVTTTTPDYWSVLLSYSSTGPGLWSNEGLFSEDVAPNHNLVLLDAISSTTFDLRVFSDRNFVEGGTLHANGDTATGTSFFYRFIDNGDAAVTTSTVPDQQASATLLGISLLGCFALKKKLSR